MVLIAFGFSALLFSMGVHIHEHPILATQDDSDTLAYLLWGWSIVAFIVGMDVSYRPRSLKTKRWDSEAHTCNAINLQLAQAFHPDVDWFINSSGRCVSSDDAVFDYKERMDDVVSYLSSFNNPNIMTNVHQMLNKKNGERVVADYACYIIKNNSSKKVIEEQNEPHQKDIINNWNKDISDGNLSLELANLIIPERDWYLTDRYKEHKNVCVTDHSPDFALQFDSFCFKSRLGEMCVWWANHYHEYCLESGLTSILQSKDPARELALTIYYKAIKQ